MLDCRGLACPQPVIKAKDLLEAQAPQSLEVLVDKQAASQNVGRFLGSQGYQTTVTPHGADFLIKAQRDPSLPLQDVQPAAAACAGPKRILVFVRSDTMGRGDDSLGADLMKNFLFTLKEMRPALWRLVFVNSGVKLCCQDSANLEALQQLQQGGVDILVCGTCLNHYGLLEQKAVGETTNMLDIVTSLQVASKVITA